MFQLNTWKTTVVLSVLCLATAVAASAQTLTTLADFNYSNGYMPGSATLIQATDGNLYGTTTGGGAYGAGTVFEVTSNGEVTTLYSFCAQSGCPDGKNPNAGLIQASDGDFYGTASQGGSSNDGTVFRITPEGTLTTLHSFVGTDGANPNAALIEVSNGTFYGTTSNGGANNACPTGPGCGTVFEITATGKLTTLHSFVGTDGRLVDAPLVEAADGDFYGTTAEGGANDCSPYPGCGTVFKMNPAGGLITLYTFHSADGWFPAGALVQVTNGSFYGTTNWGGATNLGTIFEITPGGKLTTLHSFDLTDGSMPGIGMAQASDGNLYGTTTSGGPTAVYGTFNAANGTIFEITPEGEFTNLHNFELTDGSTPWGGLVQATDGNFYGTTIAGGTSVDCGSGGCGTVFSLSTGLAPFVKLQPASGEPGVAVTILGTDLTGTTKVTFNGKAAEFKAVSSTEIQTTVPAGATTGKVEVVTPQGTLSSNVAFGVQLHPKVRIGRPVRRPQTLEGTF
jgi:uncharacterized repeat protein (TIGR03803 family)